MAFYYPPSGMPVSLPRVLTSTYCFDEGRAPNVVELTSFGLTLPHQACLMCLQGLLYARTHHESETEAAAIDEVAWTQYR
jgi:hypothetical protein